MGAPNILADTAGMTQEQWLDCRRHGLKGDIPYTVGGSDVAAIFGVSPWVTPLELWLTKKGRLAPQAKKNQRQLEMGHLLEPVAAHWFGQLTGSAVKEDTCLYQHADHPYALANFDRRFFSPKGEPGILECKSCTYHKAEDWADGAVPVHYELQLRFYLAVADLELGAFSAVWGNNPDEDIATPFIRRDRAKEDRIFEKLDEWIWSLENDRPPTMQDVVPKLALESLARIYGSSKEQLPTVKLPRECEKDLRKIARLQAEAAEKNREARQLEKEIESQSVRIAELMGSHEHGELDTGNGRIVIDFATRKTRRPDSKALREGYPEVYREVLKTTESRKVKVRLETA